MQEDNYIKYEDVYEFDDTLFTHKYEGPLIHSYKDGNAKITIERPTLAYEDRMDGALGLWNALKRVVLAMPVETIKEHGKSKEQVI